MKHSAPCLLAVMGLLVASSGLADEGELGLGVGLSMEGANTTHPASSAALFAPGSTFIYKPKIAIDGRYGVSPSFSLGAGFAIAGSTAIRTDDVTIDNSSASLLTAQYLELSAPLALAYRFDSGSFLSAVAELEVGPMLTYWGTQDLVDFNDLDDAGLPADLEKNAPDVWLFGGFAQLSLLFNARLFDVVILDVGPTAALSFNTLGQPAVHAGLVLRPSFVWGGPL